MGNWLGFLIKWFDNGVFGKGRSNNQRGHRHMYSTKARGLRPRGKYRQWK